MNIIDISIPIYSGMPIYPGTAKTTITEVKSGSGTSVLSQISMTSHAGTHLDAPSHSIYGGKTLDQLPLETFYGECRVVDMTNVSECIRKADLIALEMKAGERILFKTSNSDRGFDTFYDDYVYVAPDAAEFMAETLVALVGIDALSIKQRGNKDNTSHTALLAVNIPILEGINLKAVPSGTYKLAAFPLNFSRIDGSPARAVLLEL